ncbi:MAG: hypothetical protein FD129_1490, partial [bacterium]
MKKIVLTSFAAIVVVGLAAWVFTLDR